DAHRYRIGTNYMDLPVNRPIVPVNSYSKDGAMRYSFGIGDPVYAPNSYGGPHGDASYGGDEAATGIEQEVIRSAYRKHAEDDDFTQAGTLVRKVFSDEERERFIDNVAGHLSKGVSKPVLEKAFEYWRNVDKATGD
ncbi:catalase, partial [Klebsiella pneumoniae]|nr:catalase [Klebsiella pneumoniae]